MLRIEKFADVNKWLTAAQGPTLTNITRRSSRSTHDKYFYGTETFQEAIDLATKGWSEGASSVNEYLLKLTPFLRTVKGYRRAWTPGVLPQGGLILDKYVKGLPDCMLNRAKVPSNKFARIVFNASILNYINDSEYRRRGSLIIALVHILERNNYRIQVVCQNCTVKNDHKLVTEVVLKEYSQSLDLDRIAFWACNLAVNRRISFSYRETLEQKWITALNTGSTYGHTEDYPPPLEDKSTIYFPAISTKDRHYDNIDTMISYLKELLTRVGVLVT